MEELSLIPCPWAWPRNKKSNAFFLFPVFARLLLTCCITAISIEGTLLPLTVSLLSPESTCGRTNFTEESGYIASAGFSGGHYPTAVNCTYDIKVKNSSRIKLTWLVFDVDGSMPDCNGKGEDYAEVYIGCQYSLLTRFCNRDAVKTIPHDIYTDDNCLRIRFVSSSVTAWKYNKGFMASYASMGVSDPISYTDTCSRPKELTTTSGIIYSPSWPITYHVLTKGICEWNIKANGVDVIQLNLMSVDVYGHTGYCQSYYSDSIDIKGKKSDYASQFERIICGRCKPFSITTQFSELDVFFQKNERHTFKKKGFIIGYIAFTPGQHDSIFPPWKIVFVVVVACLAISCTFCCLLRFKRRAKKRRSRRRLLNTNRREEARIRNMTQPPYNDNSNQSHPIGQPVIEAERNSEEQRPNATRSRDTQSTAITGNTQRAREAQPTAATRDTQPPVSHGTFIGRNNSPPIRISTRPRENVPYIGRNTSPPARSSTGAREYLPHGTYTNNTTPEQQQYPPGSQYVSLHAEGRQSQPDRRTDLEHIDRTSNRVSPEVAERCERDPNPPPYSTGDPFPNISHNATPPTVPQYHGNELDGNNGNSVRNTDFYSYPHYSPHAYNPDNHRSCPQLNSQVCDNPFLSPPGRIYQNPSINQISDNPGLTSPVTRLPNPRTIDHTHYDRNEPIVGYLALHINERFDGTSNNLHQNSEIAPEYDDDERTPLVTEGRRK